jgi:hypothetical protein
MDEEEWCCGMIPGWSGQPDIEAEMAGHNVEVLAPWARREWLLPVRRGIEICKGIS